MSHPWDSVVTADEVRLHEERSGPIDREASFGSRPALVVVDMTRQYAEAGYPTSIADASAVTSAHLTLLESARGAGVPVLFSKLLMNGPVLRAAELGSLRRSAHMFVTPKGLPDFNEIAHALQPRPDEIVFGKAKPSAFFGTPLEAYLTALGIDTIIVTGMVTSGCVRATALDAVMRNYRVVVPYEAVGDYSPLQHRVALFDMHAKYLDVVGVCDVVRYFSSLLASKDNLR